MDKSIQRAGNPNVPPLAPRTMTLTPVASGSNGRIGPDPQRGGGDHPAAYLDDHFAYPFRVNGRGRRVGTSPEDHAPLYGTGSHRSVGPN